LMVPGFFIVNRFLKTILPDLSIIFRLDISVLSKNCRYWFNNLL